MTQLKRALIVPDVHAPYHHKEAFNVLLAAGLVLRPDIVVLLGDFMDCYFLSTHEKDPRRKLTVFDEAKVTRRLLAQLEFLGASEHWYLEGNHEARLNRYMKRQAPELYGAVSIRQLLQLDERKWQYVPYKTTQCKLGKLFCTHDMGFTGSSAAETTVAAFQGNIAFGHSHRLGIAYRGNLRGETHVGANLGWLGDQEHVDYMYDSIAKRAWHHGFGIAYIEPSGEAHVQAVPIINGRCVVDGKLVSAKK